MTRPHVTVVGDVGLDVLTRPSGPIVAGQETRARVLLTPGGAGANTAARLAACDADVTLIARIGGDQAGRTATADLTAAGIDCRFAVDDGLPTGCVVVLVAADGGRTMLADRGANAALRVADVRLPELTAPAHLHLSGYVLLDNSSRAAGLAALASAMAAGWTTSVDPQDARQVAAAGADRFLAWVAGTDLLLPNDSELAALGGPERALSSVGAVAVTHGPGGASWHSTGWRLDAATPDGSTPNTGTPIDTTGAGDAFNAGLLAAWLAGADQETALAAGVAAGSATITHVGARKPTARPPGR